MIAAHVPPRDIERTGPARLTLARRALRTLVALAAAVASAALFSCSEPANGAGGKPAAAARVALAREPVARRVWRGPAVAPSLRPAFDGRHVAYIDPSTGDVTLHDLADGSDRRLTNDAASITTGDFYDAPIASPDGHRVAYARWNGVTDRFELGVLDDSGHRLETIPTNATETPMLPLLWSPDGQRIAVAVPQRDGTTDLGVVDLSGKLVTVPGGSRLLRYAGGLQFAHNANTLLADAKQHPEPCDSFDVIAVDVASGRSSPIITHAPDDRLAGLSPDGSLLLFFSDRAGTTSLYAQPVSSSLHPLGEPLAIRRDVWSAIGLGTTQPGSLLYTIQSGLQTLYAVQLDPATGAVGAPRQLATAVGLTHAAIGDWAAGGASTVQNFLPGRGHGGHMLSVRSVLSGDTREIATSLSEISTLHVSPDGARALVNGRDERNRIGVYVVDVATGATRSIAAARFDVPSMVRGAGWSADSRTAFYTVEEFRRDRLRLMARDVLDGTERSVLELPCTAGCGGRISPDGRVFAMVQPAPETPAVARLLVITTDGRETREVARSTPSEPFAGAPVWTPDGRSVIIALGERDHAPRRARFLIARADGTAPRVVTVDVTGPVTGVRVHPDGRQILFFAGETAFELWSLERLELRPTH